ncbi:hypothetical protein BJ875DRAFT_444736 [Amylocarpus encephaloides]|uniref:Uncharacterized protein n=1 Tax=Amylocarpus encephaloides TaxID=45428 RepID=A0A9P7YBL1_9HELO|nr:hypothetical protein BJ875DRAFT_444736 [Amylocarpus encephaloides]
MAGTKKKVLKTGNQNSKAGFGGKPPKENAQQEMKEKVRLATLKFDNHRKFVEERKKKLEWLTQSYDKDADPQYKEEYERLKKEVEGLVGNLIKYDMEFDRVAREKQGEEQDEEIDTVTEEGKADEDEILVPTSVSSSELLHIDLTGPNSSSGQLNTDDDPDYEAFFTPEQAREATGQSYGGKIVAWKNQIKSKPVIVMYGPRSAAKFERSTAAREDIDFDEKETQQFGADHRLGDEKVKRKLIRRKKEFIAIHGLAYSCDLDDLKPKEKGEKRRLPPLEIRVKWEINRVISVVWEVRSSIRHLWSSHKACDEYIYLAAKYHAARHQEWLDGQHQGKYMSRTLAPGLGRLGHYATNPSPHDAMLKFREQWCALEGIDSHKMDAAAKADFLLTWNRIEVQL